MNQNINKTMFQNSQVRILIADREKAILEAYQEMLSSLSFDLVVCQEENDVMKAVEKASEENQTFAVAFLDIQMFPEPNSMGTLTHVREGAPLMEIVMVAGPSDMSLEKIACRIFPNDDVLYLQKPLNAFEIRQMAFALARKWQKRGKHRKVRKELEKQVEEQADQVKRLNEELGQQVAKHKRTEAVLRESREIFYSFMRYQPTLAFIKNHEGRYVYVNEAYKRTLGIDSANHIGKTDDELWPPEIARPLKANDQIVMSEGKVLNILETVKIGNVIQHHLVSKFPIFKLGRPSFLAGTAIDFTGKIHNEKRLREFKDGIRSPVSTIADRCDALIKRTSGTSLREELDIIRNAVDALDKLIKDVLDIPGIKAGELGFEHTLLSIDEVMNVSADLELEPERVGAPWEAERPFPDALPGLDIRDGVERLGGAWTLYLDLLMFFCDDKKHFVQEFHELIGKNEFQTALITAHALKGSAATISAVNVRQAAKALEEACHSEDRGLISDMLKPVEDALAQVRASCKKIPGLPTTQANLAEPAQTDGIPPDLPKLSKAFQNLDKGLRACDPLASEAGLREVRRVLTGCFADSETDHLLGNLDQEASRYNFDDARTTLNKLAQKAGIPFK